MKNIGVHFKVRFDHLIYLKIGALYDARYIVTGNKPFNIRIASQKTDTSLKLV